MVKNHETIDQTLDKIREKMIDRTLESKTLLAEYEQAMNSNEATLWEAQN